MKLIMENWRRFALAESEETELNIYFSGKCKDCDPKAVREKYDFAKWEMENGNLLILSHKDTKYNHEGKISKIIGFSNGAQAAFNLHTSNPEAQLVFIDPWIPRDFKAPGNFDYYGTSCFIARGPNKRRLKVLKKTCNKEETKFSDHLKYFKDYFKI